ncbi:MAG: hypothetical protein ACI88H_004290 [Cocleimonas sp.]|jgi:hypothetical protein
MKNMKNELFGAVLKKTKEIDDRLTDDEQKEFADFIHGAITEVSNYFDHLPAELQQNTINLTKRGWFVCFFDDELDDYHKKQNGLVGKTPEEQDQFLETYFSSKLDDIEKTITQNIPERNNQLSQSFTAHRDEMYYLSIPTLLILAESLCRDLGNNTGLYDKKKQKPMTRKLLNCLIDIDPLEEVLFQPLREKTEITKTNNTPTDEDKSLFHRHLIIHGHSNSYGNKTNSLKAISLVYYVYYTLMYISKRDK